LFDFFFQTTRKDLEKPTKTSPVARVTKIYPELSKFDINTTHLFLENKYFLMKIKHL